MRSRLVAALCVLLPLAVTTAVITRQARPFAIVSDDHSYYGIATAAAKAARSGIHRGIGPAVHGFFQASSVKGELPPHISRKRPLLLWIWSAAYLAGGNQGLEWLWRILYVLTVGTLYLVVHQRSSLVVAASVTAVVAAAPAMQGLLTWMSCSTYLVGYPLLLLGIWALRSGHGMIPTAAGLASLVLAMLSREVAFLLVPTAVALDMWYAGRRRLACTLPVLAAVTWLILPGEDRSVLGMLGSDPVLVVRSSLTVIAGHLASLVRNLGFLLTAAVAVALSRRRLLMSALLAIALVLPGVAILTPLVLLVESARSRPSMPGSIWAAVTILSLCLYGTFTSRYAVEPLLGYALAVAPALYSRSVNRWGWIMGPLIAWQLASCLMPDIVYRWPPARVALTSVDQRFGPLAAVTAWREREWLTFAGRAPSPWVPMPGWSVLSREGMPEDRVLRSGEYLRLGAGCALHCPRTDDVVASRSGLWEWNVWFWRVIPPRKRAGVHVEGASPWEVHTGQTPPDHQRCRRVTALQAPRTVIQANRAIGEWLADVPELMNPTRARAWLSEVWETEGGCPQALVPASFREQELGRLFLRDDGWLDLGELAYLREQARRTSSP